MAHRSRRVTQLLVVSAVAFAILAPAAASAQERGDEPRCFIRETGTPDVPIDFDEIKNETGVPIICEVTSHGGAGGGVGNESGGGVGAVGRIDAGAGAAAAGGSATPMPLLLVAGAGLVGSVARRLRRQ